MKFIFIHSYKRFSIGRVQTSHAQNAHVIQSRFFGTQSALKQTRTCLDKLIVLRCSLFLCLVYFGVFYLCSLQEYHYPHSHWSIEHRGSGLYKEIVQASQSTQYG